MKENRKTINRKQSRRVRIGFLRNPSILTNPQLDRTKRGTRIVNFIETK